MLLCAASPLPETVRAPSPALPGKTEQQALIVSTPVIVTDVCGLTRIHALDTISPSAHRGACAYRETPVLGESRAE